MPHLTTKTILVCFFAGLLCAPTSVMAADEIDFRRDVAPILESRCWDCHGEYGEEAGLRLDKRGIMLRGGDSGLAAIVPGDPDNSYMIEAIKHVGDAPAMPPDDDKLPDEEIEILSRWIQQGAKWPGQMEDVAELSSDHWSFQPLADVQIPDVGDASLQPIDAFLLQRLQDQGLSFSAPADPRDLIRRASIVLTGLPPTPKQTAAFVRASEQDAEQAYVELIDRLLSSPHFGERWAQHWLDVIRWAETNGSESNLYRKNAWMYRDYVVAAFNDDKPYDDFVREQIAGDLMGHGDATGFLVSGPHVPAATVGQEPSAIRQARADRMDEVLQTVGASVMGVTIGCARCHNHKFDPISIQDYYAMSAVFQDVEFGSRYPELNADHPRVQQAQQLRAELESLRGEMRQQGWAWVEDWTGYEEVHFPAKSASEIRLSFGNRWLQADELEIIEAGASDRNLAHQRHGTQVSDNPVTHMKNTPPQRLIDGNFGTQVWRAKSEKGVKETPWLVVQFKDEQTFDHLRISSNREDFLETAYLEGMNKNQYGDFKLELKDEQGQWQAFASTARMRERDNENQKRAELVEKIQQTIDQLQAEGPQPAFLARFVEPTETFVLGRGSPENPREQVHAAAPKLLDGELGIDPGSPGPQRRQAFADWLVDPANPLTPRVMANRLWHHIFGTGIVSTPSDFGEAGATPTHPELLDWLAGQFVDSDWSMKEMIRMIVMSRAFRQSSAPREDGLSKDAAATLLWRFPPRRVAAEVIRDSILQASGTLDERIGGPSYRIHNVKKRYAQWQVVDNYGRQTWRRMLYQERMRRVDDQMFTAFDFPDCGQIRAKRPVSTTPLQALNLMNSDFVIKQSQLLAKRAQDEAGSQVEDQVRRCFELLFGRQPSSEELSASMELANQHGLPLLCRTLINANEFAFLP